MSEQTPENTEKQSAGEPQDKPLGENGEKALKAERDRANELDKQLKEATAKLDEIARQNETELETAKREASEAAKNAETATVAAFREAAVKFGGISAEDADLFLTGNDVETLAKQAERLVERTPTTPQPKPDLTQGGNGGIAKQSTADQFAAVIESSLT